MPHDASHSHRAAVLWNWPDVYRPLFDTDFVREGFVTTTGMKTLIRKISGNQLFELILLDSERHEILSAYERAQEKRHPYPCLAVQIFVHNVRHGATAAVYRSHAADLLQFAHDYQIEWLEQRIVQEYRADRDARKNQ